jgi:hypothetical protein
LPASYVPVLLGALFTCACPQLLDDDFGESDGELGQGGGAGHGPSSGGLGGGAGDGLHVLGTVPEDGAVGVLPDTAFVITFSAPMKRSSVVAAYRSGDVPASGASFSWSEDDSVLRIQPERALRAESGADPAGVAALEYSFEISSLAEDQTGRRLAATHVSFNVARSITQTLTAVRDRDLTGNWRGDGVYGVADCERVDTSICVGDSISTGEPTYKGFMTFDLRDLPANLVAITAADLGWVVSGMFGTPFDDLGTLRIEPVSFEVIGDAAFSGNNVAEPANMSAQGGIGASASASVLPAVSADWASDNESQFRLAFATGSDQDGVADLFQCEWSTARLQVSYWLP